MPDTRVPLSIEKRQAQSWKRSFAAQLASNTNAGWQLRTPSGEEEKYPCIRATRAEAARSMHITHNRYSIRAVRAPSARTPQHTHNRYTTSANTDTRHSIRYGGRSRMTPAGTPRASPKAPPPNAYKQPEEHTAFARTVKRSPGCRAAMQPSQTLHTAARMADGVNGLVLPGNTCLDMQTAPGMSQGSRGSSSTHVGKRKRKDVEGLVQPGNTCSDAHAALSVSQGFRGSRNRPVSAHVRKLRMRQHQCDIWCKGDPCKGRCVHGTRSGKRGATQSASQLMWGNCPSGRCASRNATTGNDGTGRMEETLTPVEYADKGPVHRWFKCNSSTSVGCYASASSGAS